MTPAYFTTFPLKPGTKVPAVRWRDLPPGSQSTDVDHGVRCGAGLVVVDIDRKPGGVDGFNAWGHWEALHGEVETYSVRTPSGGMHFYFSYPEDLSIRNSASTLAPGVDIRGEGGYVVGAGSHGGAYDLEDDSPIAPAPQWLLDLLTADKGPATRPTTNTPDTTLLRDVYIDDLKRAIKGASDPLAEFWRLVSKAREPMPKPCSAWNEYLLRATMWLAGRSGMDDASGASIVLLMGPSISLMHERRREEGKDIEGLDARTIAHMYDRAARKVRADRAEVRGVAAAIERLRTQRDEEGTEGASLLQHRRSYYLAHETMGFIGPFIKEELIPQARRRETFPVDRPNKSGLRESTVPELMKDFGAPVDGVVQDLSLERAELSQSPSGGIILHAPAIEHIRVSACFHPQIDEWLRMLGGDTLLDWVATVRELDQANPAVWLSGSGGTGKTLFVRGLAGLWGRAPVPMSDALGRFNDVLSQCPIIFADEDIPRTQRGFTDVEGLKRLIADTSRLVEPKGLPQLELRGAVRVVIASNNMDSIKASKDLTAEDAEALCDRLIHIRREGAEARRIRVFLDGIDVQRQWLDSGALTSHLQWIVENREAPAQGRRFRVAADAGDLRGAMLTSAGGASFYICRAISDWLVHDKMDGPGIIYRDGSVWVTASGVAAMVQGQLRDTSQLGPTLKRISTGPKKNLTDGVKRRNKMWPVSISRLVMWAEGAGWHDADDLWAAAERRDAKEREKSA